MVRPMSESILDEAIGYARARLDLLDDDDARRALESRLDALEASARRIALPVADAARVVQLVSAVLALRDDAPEPPSAMQVVREKQFVAIPAVALHLQADSPKLLSENHAELERGYPLG